MSTSYIVAKAEDGAARKIIWALVSTIVALIPTVMYGIALWAIPKTFWLKIFLSFGGLVWLVVQILFVVGVTVLWMEFGPGRLVVKEAK